MRYLILILTLISGISLCHAQQQQISTKAAEESIMLWPDGKMPYAIDNPRSETVNERGNIANVSVPSMLYRPAQGQQVSDACVIVCPGGGYGNLAWIHEGTNTADYLTARGIHVFILKYRHSPYKAPAPLADVQRAIRLVRRNAAIYGINPQRIGIMGYSAGGHLAASASTLYNEKIYDMDDDRDISARPDYSILIYPVITMSQKTHGGSRDNLLGKEPTPEMLEKYSCEKQVNADTPPAFIVHSSDDNAVPVDNAIGYYQALIAHKIDAEMHIYNTGGHGYSIAGRPGETNEHWAKALADWGTAFSKKQAK